MTGLLRVLHAFYGEVAMNLNSHLRRWTRQYAHAQNISTAQCRLRGRQCIRFKSTRLTTQTPEPGTPAADVEQVSNFYEQNYARPTLITFDFFRRVFKFTFAGLVILAGGTWSAFEAAHLWVEHIELSPEVDPDGELGRWGWSEQLERWSGGPAGGTDSSLGYKARHAIRGAWMSENWGTGSDIISQKSVYNYQRGAGSQAVEARLEYAHDFLSIALTTAFSQPTRLQAHTVPELLARHANTLERMGSLDSLYEARTQYERAWATMPGKGPDAARTALKIANLCARLGDASEARAWWARSLLISTGKSSADDLDPKTCIPNTLPASPLLQRTITSTLSSISAYYAQTGNLKEAREVEERGLKLLAMDLSTPNTSPAHTLHEMYLKHRSSLLSVHLAEVDFALKSDPQASLVRLRDAAESAEQVAFTLTGLPFTHPDSSSRSIPHPPTSQQPLHTAFKGSRTLRKPASDLLRDARRSAAESWRLSGILYEKQGSKVEDSAINALRCYERALRWVGASMNSHGVVAQPGPNILESDWKELWGDYVRARDAVRGQK